MGFILAQTTSLATTLPPTISAFSNNGNGWWVVGTFHKRQTILFLEGDGGDRFFN